MNIIIEITTNFLMENQSVLV